MIIQNRTYLGNDKLRKAGIKIEYTLDQIREYKRCSEDPVYFIMNYVYIVTLNDGSVKFGLYPKQKELINHYNDNRFSLLMAARQSGKTDCTWAYILWTIIFQPYKKCAVLAHKESKAKETLTRLKKAYEKLPDWMQQGVTVWNKKSIELENESGVFIAATSENGVTGETISLLYLDEFALVSASIAESFWTSAWPTISSGTDSKVIISSTPRGYNLFWKFWEEAKKDKNDFKHFMLYWYDVPWRNAEWLEQQRRTLGEVKFQSEVMCEFKGSMHTLIGANFISSLPQGTPISEDEHLKIYEYPKEKHSYVTIVDTARGVGEDYSAAITIDVTELPYNVVSVYRNNEISPYEFPEVIYQIAKEYNESYLLIELNDAGGEVGNLLHYTYEYTNMFYTEKTKKGLTDYLSKKTEIGIRTTGKVKTLGCSLLRTIIENNQIKVNDLQIISELSTFVKKKNSYAADTGYNDDLAMSLVLFSWLTQQKIFESLTNIDNRQALFSTKLIKVNNHLILLGINSSEKQLIIQEDKPDEYSGDNWIFNPMLQTKKLMEDLKEFKEYGGE